MTRLLVILFALPAFAAEPALVRRLLAFDSPATRAQLETLGGAPELERLTQHDSPVVRRAALASLALFPTSQTRTVLVAQLSSTDDVTRKTTLEALAFAFPRDATLERIFFDSLDDPTPSVRRAAIRALRPWASPAAKLVLEERVPRETDAETLATLTAVLAHNGAPATKLINADTSRPSMPQSAPLTPTTPAPRK